MIQSIRINFPQSGDKVQKLVCFSIRHYSALLLLSDFDVYYKNLRPRVGDECGGETEKNVPHPQYPEKIVNCRNVWFREFWSQHHKCTFGGPSAQGIKACTGDETMNEYDQEGLVPFVGKTIIYVYHTAIVLLYCSLCFIPWILGISNLWVHIHVRHRTLSL